MPAHKNYVAVSFNNGQHAVIPNHWLLQKGNMLSCRWPPSDVDERSANFEHPQLNWEIYSVKAIITEASTYEGADKKLYTPEGYEPTTEELNASLPATGQGVQSMRASAIEVIAPDQPSTSAQAVNLTSLLATMLEVKSEVRKVKAKIKNNEVKQNTIMDIVQSLEKKPQPHQKLLPKAAETSEQLDELVNHETLLREELKCHVGLSLKDSTQRMFQRLMTPELAVQYSYSGLGSMRQPTKKAFKSYRAYHILVDVLAQVGYNVDMKSKITTIQDVLRHSNEWGYKNKRTPGDQNSTCSQSKSSAELNGASVELRTPSPSNESPGLHLAASSTPPSMCHDTPGAFSSPPSMPFRAPTMPLNSPIFFLASRLQSVSSTDNIFNATSCTPGHLSPVHEIHRDAPDTPFAASSTHRAAASTLSSTEPNTLSAPTGSAKQTLPRPRVVMPFKKRCMGKTGKIVELSKKKSLHIAPTIKNSISRKCISKDQDSTSASSDSDDAVTNSDHLIDSDHSGSNSAVVPETDSDS